MADVIIEFNSEDLVAHGYIDKQLPKYTGADQLPELHSSASNLLSKLDHYSEEVTWQLETALGDLVRSTNRLEYEVELLKSDVSGLAADIEDSTGPKIQTLATSNNDTSRESLEQLRKLDLVKSKMESVKKVFEQAKLFNETSVRQEIMALVNDKKLTAALARIDLWESICQIWKGTDKYNEKVNFMNGLRKRVETIMTASEQDQEIASPDNITEDENGPLRPDSATSEANKSYYGLIGQIKGKIF